MKMACSEIALNVSIVGMRLMFGSFVHFKAGNID